MSGALPSTLAIDVTPRSRMPHGTMWSNIVRSGSTLSAKPCRVRPCATRTPIAAIFSSPTHTPVYPRSAARVDAEVGERRDQHRFEPAYVRDDVALTGAPLGERDDRVPDELAGPVVRDVAAAIGVHELGADRRRVAQHVREIRARPERVDVRVLLQQEVVVGRRARGSRAATPRPRGTEPARATAHEVTRAVTHASSASQSRVSRTVRTSLRNEAA